MNDKFLNRLIKTRDFKNSLYGVLKHNFLYNSNKIEGSTFTTEALALLIDKNIVEGKHTLDDVQETVNSSYVFDTVIDTLGQDISHSFLKNLHSSLFFNTTLHSRGFSGIYKTIPNMILGTDIKLAQPFEVEPLLDELLEWYSSIDNVTLESISEFHYRFERIHPFQDGNGRIGRFLMLKQMLENNLPLKIVSWDNEDLYRSSLASSKIGDYSPIFAYINNLEDFKEIYREFWV